MGFGKLEVSPDTKLLTFTRDLTLPSGNVAYTGVGFKPKALIVLGILNANVVCIGLGDENNAEWCLYRSNPEGFAYSATLLVRVPQTLDVNDHYASLATLDSDGFTLAWTKVGASTGVAYFAALCLGKKT